MKKSIKFTKTYDHSINNVWEALTNAEALSTWLMPCNFKAELGYEFEFRTEAKMGFDGITKCKVLTLEKPHELSFTWSGGGLNNTIVTFKLESTIASKTKLEFEHSGFEGFVNSVIVRKILARGWKKKILTIKLPQYLAS